MLDHNELFGLKQVWANAKARTLPEMRFRTPGFYKLVRHPIQVGVLVVFWATPEMSLGRLVLCAAITGYIVIALRFFEERDLLREFPTEYAAHRKRVGMLIPRRRTTSSEPATPSATLSIPTVR